MEAIITKYLGPTDFRGAYIKATCESGSVKIAYDHALNLERNHERAAIALIKKLGWEWQSMGCGSIPHGYAFVAIARSAQ